MQSCVFYMSVVLNNFVVCFVFVFVFVLSVCFVFVGCVSSGCMQSSVFYLCVV